MVPQDQPQWEGQLSPVSGPQVIGRELNSPLQIPALTDKHTDGSTIRVFESGAMMQYLVDKYDTEHKLSYPFGTKEYYETSCWVCQKSPPLEICYPY